jgi:hypothetical protein
MVSSVKELWEQAILPYNLPFTILLGMVVLFWLVSLSGALGIDALDADPGPAVDGDFNASDVPGSLLRVVNAGFVPLTVVLSVLILVMWIMSIALNFYLNPSQSILLASGIILVSFIVGVIATKIITQPLVPLMRRLKQAENAAPVIGEIGVVRSIQLDSEYGQVEVQRPGGAPALLNARLGPESAALPRGTTVAILSMDPISGVYLAREISPTPPID